MDKTVTILAGRKYEAEAMLIKFAKKAVRYGVPFSYSFGEVYEKKFQEQTDNMWYPHGVRKYMARVLDVTITGEKPVVGDFEFLASIELTPKGNFVDMVPGVELDPKYRTVLGTCDHCGYKRSRNHVFVVRNRENDEIMQVGRTCLRDFMGTDDPKWIIQRFKFLRLIDSFGEEMGFGGCGGWRSYWVDDAKYVLGIALASVRIWGWVSKGQAYHDDSLTPTVSRYWTAVAKRDKYNAEEQDKIRDELKEEDFATAQKIIDWVRADESDNDYMWNLRLALADDLLDSPKRLGLVVSAVSAWHRHVDRELKAAKRKELDKTSTHQGAVGERLRDIPVRLEMRRGMGDNGYGWTELLKMRDEAGNLYTWFTGSAPSVDIGEDMVITGTVKGHREFNGVNETQLTRVKVS